MSARDLRAIAQALGGEVSGGQIRAQGPVIPSEIARSLCASIQRRPRDSWFIRLLMTILFVAVITSATGSAFQDGGPEMRSPAAFTHHNASSLIRGRQTAKRSTVRAPKMTSSE